MYYYGHFSTDATLISSEFRITPVNPEPFITFRADDDNIALEGIETLFLTLSGSDVASITNDRLEINIIDTDGVWSSGTLLLLSR